MLSTLEHDYYSRMKESKISQRKSHMEWSLRRQVLRFSVCLQRSHSGWCCLWQQVRRLTGRLVTNSFSVAGPNPRLPKGKKKNPKSILGTSLGKHQWGVCPCTPGDVVDPWSVACNNRIPHAEAFMPQLLRLLATTRGSVHSTKIPWHNKRSCVQQLRPSKVK